MPRNRICTLLPVLAVALPAVAATVVVLTNGDDTYFGGPAAEEVSGLAGDDRLYGDGGDDALDGGDGADWLHGGGGWDTLSGGRGADHLYGDLAHDTLLGSYGNDRLEGGVGFDALLGGPGADVLVGGAGGDLLAGGAGDDTYLYRPGDGDDTVVDRAGHDRLVLQRIRPEQLREEVRGNDRVLTIDAAGTLATITIQDGALPCGACTLTVEHDLRPNVVLVVADDLGWGDLGSYGQAKIHTPELDAMAAEGVRMTSFYAGAPHCTPSRAALLTGLTTGHTQVRLEGALVADGPTLPELFQQAGYATGMFGKWGLAEVSGASMVTAADPAAGGFDEWAGQLTNRDAQVYYLDSPAQPPGTPQHPFYPDVRPFLFTARDGRSEPLPLPPERYIHGELFARALSFVERHQGEPFFLYLPVAIPHAELVAEAADLAEYQDAHGRSLFPETPWHPAQDGRDFDRWNEAPRATYAAMVSRLSRDVGQLLDRLRALGLDEDTLVLFSSDNGPHDAGGIGSPAFFRSAGPFSGMKWSLREGGLRVPLLAWWPGHIQPTLEDTPAAFWDLLPTLTDLAGLPPPASDGASLLPLWTRGDAPAQRSLYWETFAPRADSRQALRLGRYKLLRRLGGAAELYDLSTDPAEAHDLAADPAYCATLRDLATRLNASRTNPHQNPGGAFTIPPLAVSCP